MEQLSYTRDKKEYYHGRLKVGDLSCIDGDHRYSIVRKDIRLAKFRVRDGGVLCGDDLDVQVSDLNPVEHLEVLMHDEDAGITRSGVSYHAGVAQAVHDNFGVVSVSNSLWAMRKVGGEWKNVSL